MFARDKFRIERRRAAATARLAHANDNCRLARPAPVAPCRHRPGRPLADETSRLAGSNSTGAWRPCPTSPSARAEVDGRTTLALAPSKHLD